MRGKAVTWTILTIALAACSGSSNGSGFGTDGDGGASGRDGGGTPPPPNDGGIQLLGDGGTPDGSTGCSGAASNFVYVIDGANALYKFDPPSLAFTKIGTVDCTGFATPYSMAVARDGTAYVVFTDGHLYKVDTSNAHCSSTPFQPGQHNFLTFGMGYSTDAPGGTAETLYVSDSGMGSGGPSNEQGLAKIDTTTFTLTPINAYDKVTARAEMTGTGDARLFGAFEGSPYVVAEIEKSDAKILSQAPQNAINYAPDSSNFAFAFWGGDFWLFVGPGTSTDVFQYRPSTGTTNKVKSVNFEIVGAGVSTCAPTTPPK